MTLGVNSATKASDNWGAQIGKGADNAPRIKLSFVGHETFLVVVVDCLANVF
jgi:hypothetical protein